MAILRKWAGGRIFFTEYLYLEILRGIRSGHDDLAEIQTALSVGWLEKIELRTSREKALFEKLTGSLGLGEASGIAIAAGRRMMFASDDLAARRDAEKEGVLLTGTVGILIGAVRRGVIQASEADRILRLMIKNGFYSPVRSLRALE